MPVIIAIVPFGPPPNDGASKFDPTPVKKVLVTGSRRCSSISDVRKKSGM